MKNGDCSIATLGAGDRRGLLARGSPTINIDAMRSAHGIYGVFQQVMGVPTVHHPFLAGIFPEPAIKGTPNLGNPHMSIVCQTQQVGISTGPL